MVRPKHALLLALILHALTLQNGAHSEETDNYHEVKTNSGSVRGKSVTTPSGKTVTTFLGIPYANPPIGESRFKPPQDVQPWSEVRDATKPSKACVQLFWSNYLGVPGAWWETPAEEESEDCLYLNVWVPKVKPEKAAVLVWVHGGGYFCGNSMIERYSGETLAAEENIIVVSFNYRLTVFGFLYSDNPSEAPGNVGLLDQSMAIRWITQNIEYFGGDADKITIMGHSAGSSSVSFQLAANRVQRGILLSGTHSHHFALAKPNAVLENTVKLATETGCLSSTSDSSEMIGCLRKLTSDQLLKATIRVALSKGPMAFVPVEDGGLVSKNLNYDHIKEVMLGETKEDGAFIVNMLARDLFSRDYSHEEWIRATKLLIVSDNSEVAELLHAFYKNWTDPDDEEQKRSSYVNLCNDVIMSCPNRHYGHELIKRGVKSYRFIFDHVPSVSKNPKWIGSLHGDEIEFVFGGVLKPEKGYTDAEMTLSKNMMKRIGNFVKTGNPNSPKEVESANYVQWPTFNQKRQHLHFGLETKVGSNHRERECLFWKYISSQLPRKEFEEDSCFLNPPNIQPQN